MAEQPEALRLADAVDPFVRKHSPDHLTCTVAAAELRRLEAENEMFRVMHQSHADKLKAVGAINAQLLEALQIEETIYLHEKRGVPAYIRAAIAAAKGEE